MSIYVSASMIDEFVSCNRKVHYRLNKDVSVQSKEMVAGEVVHATIEKYWNDEDKAKCYVQDTLELRLPGDSQIVDFSVECVDVYFRNFRNFNSDGDLIENKFKLPLGKDVYLVGMMDRISNGNIFDWKTKRNPPTNVDKEIQFIVYDWAYSKLYGKDAAGVYFASLTNGRLIKYNKDPAYVSILFGDVIPDLIDTIKSGNYIRNGVFRKQCYRCQYFGACFGID